MFMNPKSSKTKVPPILDSCANCGVPLGQLNSFMGEMVWRFVTHNYKGASWERMSFDELELLLLEQVKAFQEDNKPYRLVNIANYCFLLYLKCREKTCLS